MLLTLVRHGESAFNVEGRVQGQIDTPLSELGLQQAAALTAAFATQTIDAIYASPLQRAMNTARPLAAATGCEIVVDDRLREINAGIFQNHTWPEIRDLYGEAGIAWHSQDPDYRIPDGETRRELMQRGLAALQSVHDAGHEHAVVVSHGGLLSAALKGLFEIPAVRNPFRLYNASLSVIEWTDQPRLLTLNQIEHLAAIAVKSRTGDL